MFAKQSISTVNSTFLSMVSPYINSITTPMTFFIIHEVVNVLLMLNLNYLVIIIWFFKESISCDTAFLLWCQFIWTSTQILSVSGNENLISHVQKPSLYAKSIKIINGINIYMISVMGDIPIMVHYVFGPMLFYSDTSCLYFHYANEKIIFQFLDKSTSMQLKFSILFYWVILKQNFNFMICYICLRKQKYVSDTLGTQ